MDPDEALRIIIDPATDKDELLDACAGLHNWLKRGGFRPKKPLRWPSVYRFWPGTGTPWAILSPHPHSSIPLCRDHWTLVRYDARGTVIDAVRIFD